MDTQEAIMEKLPPHVLIFPFSAQGHVNSMLKLAELLVISGLHVTFLLSHRIHAKLVNNPDVKVRLANYPGLRLETISDGILGEGQGSGKEHLTEIFKSISEVIKPNFIEMIVSNRLEGEDRRPVSCMILDGVYSFGLDLGEEKCIPVIYMRTISACSFWSYFCIPKLIESGEIPFDGNNLDAPICSIPGMESFLRRRDLPSICRLTDLSNPDFQFFKTETLHSTRARGFILNTFEDLEGPILSQIQTAIPNIYTIGPLHLLLNARLKNQTLSPPLASSSSLLDEDRSCLTWLDSQPFQSVVYVSFGSFAVTTKDQMMEFWHGLVNSGQRFLWVIRPDIVIGGGEGQWKSETPTELEIGTRERGYLVEWAPQQDVLAHEAVGGFLTHSGWNSTLESIGMGKPMICWPYFADQQINSRFVGEVWKIGLDMKDTCDRLIVEKMVKDLMVVKKNDLVKSASRMAQLAKRSAGDGGSSCCNLDRLIEDIRLMCLPVQSLKLNHHV